MHHPLGPVLPEQRQCVGVGVPIVEDDRQLQLICQCKLPLQHSELNRPGRTILIVVIQAELPHGHALFIREEQAQCVEIRIRNPPGSLGVEACGRPDVIIAVRQLQIKAGGRDIRPAGD